MGTHLFQFDQLESEVSLDFAFRLEGLDDIGVFPSNF